MSHLIVLIKVHESFNSLYHFEFFLNENHLSYKQKNFKFNKIAISLFKIYYCHTKYYL